MVFNDLYKVKITIFVFLQTHYFFKLNILETEKGLKKCVSIIGKEMWPKTGFKTVYYKCQNYK